MEDMQIYKFKNKYLNYFFWQNNILVVKVKNNRNKITYAKSKYSNKSYGVIMIDHKINNIKQDKTFRELLFNIVNNIKKTDHFYINTRLIINSKYVTLSDKMEIKIKPLDNRIKNTLIVYNYFKFKDLICRQGYDTFYEQYKVAGINETQTQFIKHIKGSADDYFYICTLKNIIRIYKKEVDSKIDYNNPSFKDKMFFEYLNNYFSKYSSIVYNKEKVQKFISDYYVTEAQSEDQVVTFVENFLSFYKIVSNNDFSYENKYRFNLKNCSVFDIKKAKNIKKCNFHKYFDDVMDKKDNYNNFMFILEILDLNSYISEKKEIINYISILELLLVKGNSNISTQLQTKCTKLLKNNEFSQKEIKFAYDYRSKMIHGEYEASLDKLYKLSLIDNYKFTEKELEYEIYLNFEQMIERRLSDRLYTILIVVLRAFIFKNNYLNYIKSTI